MNLIKNDIVFLITAVLLIIFSIPIIYITEHPTENSLDNNNKQALLSKEKIISTQLSHRKTNDF